MPRPIVLFGSSFNPPTKAHLALVQYVLEQSKNQNPRPMIVLAPVYKHMFSKPDWLDFATRVHLTEVTFAREIAQHDVVVSNIEALVYTDMQNNQTSPGEDPSKTKVSCGTIDILEYLKKHPECIAEGDVNHISLMLGGDTYADFLGGKWKNAERIIALCDNIHVFARDGAIPTHPASVVKDARVGADKAHRDKLDKIDAQLASDNSAQFGGKFMLHANAITDPEIQTISSTKIRNDFSHAVKGVVKEVLDFMFPRL